MDRFLSVDSSPEIDLVSVSGPSYINYSERNFNDFLISMILLQTETVEIQITKVSVKVMIVKIKNCPRKKGSRQKHKSELKKCSCDFVEGTAEQRLERRIVKT